MNERTNEQTNKQTHERTNKQRKGGRQERGRERERTSSKIKKHGFTVTVVVLAVGTVTGVIVNALTKGLEPVTVGMALRVS